MQRSDVKTKTQVTWVSHVIVIDRKNTTRHAGGTSDKHAHL